MKIAKNVSKTVRTPWIKVLVMIPLVSCVTTISGGAGCDSYGAARLDRPSAESVSTLPADWSMWIRDLDNRMTGTCLG